MVDKYYLFNKGQKPVRYKITRFFLIPHAWKNGGFLKLGCLWQAALNEKCKKITKF